MNDSLKISCNVEYRFSSSTEIWKIFFIHELICPSIPVSRKKILTVITHSSAPFKEAAGIGLVSGTSTHAYRSDPTLSACCDESQLLLGLPPAFLRGSPIEDYPRHNRFPVSGNLVPPLCRNQKYTSGSEDSEYSRDNLISASLIIA